MSPKEFYEKLAEATEKLKLEWRLTQPHQMTERLEIRGYKKKSKRCYCPVSAIIMAETGNYVDATEILENSYRLDEIGITEKFASSIMDSADDWGKSPAQSNFSKTVRNKLLKTLNLNGTGLDGQVPA
jgi:hypothetical protein